MTIMTAPHPAENAARNAATPIVIVGHVDHGKSTLIGRLLHDTDSVPEGRLGQIVESSQKRGRPVEWSFLLDSLQIERDQGVTVDSTRIPFQFNGRDFVIVDAPGHRQFLRNMITGAADAEAAVLVVDAAEGAQEQTRRHAMLLHLIGIRHVIVLMNKADVLAFNATRLEAAEHAIRALLAQLNVSVDAVIPASARDGDNIATPSDRSPWYTGPTLVQALADVPPPAPRARLGFRMVVQDVYRFDETRYVVGRVDRGTICEGAMISIGTQGQTARVAEIARWHAPALPIAGPGESIALRLEPDIVPDRGDLLFNPDEDTPRPVRSARIQARVFWLRQEGLRRGERLTLRLGPAEYPVTVASIDSVVNLEDMTLQKADMVGPEGFATITLTTAHAVLFDIFTPGLNDGRGVLVDQYQQIVGGAPLIGAAEISDPSHTIHPTESVITAEARRAAGERQGHVFWLFGRPAAGKSTIAREVEARLFRDGQRCIVLDGDSLRAGLNSDLGFSQEDRRENIRRTAHVARMFAEAGHIVLVALVTPLKSDRALALEIIGKDFSEIFVDTTADICESRDPKGLYAAARAGKITHFTGVDAPFEISDHPSLSLSSDCGPERAAETFINYIQTKV